MRVLTPVFVLVAFTCSCSTSSGSRLYQGASGADAGPRPDRDAASPAATHPDASTSGPSPAPSHDVDSSTRDAGSTERDASSPVTAEPDAAAEPSPDASSSPAPLDAAESPAVDAGMANPSDAGCVMTVEHVANEGADHIGNSNPVSFVHNPPASGTHYPEWTAFGRYDVPVNPGYWVHNLEHGAVVFLYGPSATSEQVAALDAAFTTRVVDLACSEPRRVMTPDPQLESAVAIVTWDWVLSGNCVDPDAIETFVGEHLGNGPELVCESGGYSP